VVAHLHTRWMRLRRYREKYLREVWGQVTSILNQFGIRCTLNLVEGSMSVFTSRKTWYTRRHAASP